MIVGGGGGNTSAATTTGRDEHATSSMSMIDDDIGRTADDGSKYDMDASGEGSIVSIETHIEINNSSVYNKEKGDSANVAAVVDSPRGGATDATAEVPSSPRNKKHLTIFGSEIPPFHRATSIEYSSILQERLGVSLSWRLSKVRGYEYRCNFFFSCMPTRVFWSQMEEERKRQVDRARRAADFRGIRNDPTSSSKHAGTTDVGNKIVEGGAGILDVQTGRSKTHATSSIMSSFLSEHFSAVGLSTGWPLPMEPYFALNLVLSLSGFYYGWLLEYIRSIFVPSLYQGNLESKDKKIGHTTGSTTSSEKLVSSALKKNLSVEEKVDDAVETDDETSITMKAIS